MFKTDVWSGLWDRFCFSTSARLCLETCLEKHNELVWWPPSITALGRQRQAEWVLGQPESHETLSLETPRPKPNQTNNKAPWDVYSVAKGGTQTKRNCFLCHVHLRAGTSWSRVQDRIIPLENVWLEKAWTNVHPCLASDWCTFCRNELLQEQENNRLGTTEQRGSSRAQPMIKVGYLTLETRLPRLQKIFTTVDHVKHAK